MDTIETVREELTKQLNEIEGELWLRSSTFLAYALLGFVITGASIWRLLAGDGWWALGILGGFGLFVGSSTLWVYGRCSPLNSIAGSGQLSETGPARGIVGWTRYSGE